LLKLTKQNNASKSAKIFKKYVANYPDKRIIPRPIYTSIYYLNHRLAAALRRLLNVAPDVTCTTHLVPAGYDFAATCTLKSGHINDKQECSPC
jgi:hypothetical protein